MPLFFAGELCQPPLTLYARAPASRRKPFCSQLTAQLRITLAGTPAWSPGHVNQILRSGDQLRSGKASRASVRLSDKSVLRVYELTTLEIKPPQQADHNDVIDVKSGATYFFNRDKPQETQFQTPSASGAIRGTEFNLVVKDDGTTRI